MFVPDYLESDGLGYSFLRLTAKIYIISSMPTVLIMNSNINQTMCPFLPAFHRAIPFHTIDHTQAKDMASHINPLNAEHTHAGSMLHPPFSVYHTIF